MDWIRRKLRQFFSWLYPNFEEYKYVLVKNGEIFSHGSSFGNNFLPERMLAPIDMEFKVFNDHSTPEQGKIGVFQRYNFTGNITIYKFVGEWKR